MDQLVKELDKIDKELAEIDESERLQETKIGLKIRRQNGV